MNLATLNLDGERRKALADFACVKHNALLARYPLPQPMGESASVPLEQNQMPS